MVIPALAAAVLAPVAMVEPDWPVMAGPEARARRVVAAVAVEVGEVARS